MKAVKAASSTHEYVELVPEEDDFLAFWKSRADVAPETKRILGVEIPVPNDVPLSFMDDVTRLKDSTEPDDVKWLLTTLFGSDPLEVWLRNGATAAQLQVILAWGMANAQGQRIDFAEAAEIVTKAQAADAAGKALTPVPNRAARRASSRTPRSASTGR